MTEKYSSQNSASECANELQQEILVSEQSVIPGWSRLPLQDLYIAKTKDLAKVYFDQSFRSRLLQELKGGS
jgi:hypothetical protein